MIELRQLRYLIAAAEAGSFSRAARSLNIKQATISRHILETEKRLGMVLFDRKTRGATLTANGQIYLRTAQRIVKEFGELNAWVHATRNGHAGRLAVGFYTSFSAGNLRATLSEFDERYPEVRVRGFERDRDMLLAGIENGLLDIAILTGEAPFRGLMSRPFWSERILVAMPESHPLAARERIYWSDLTGERFLLTARDPGPPMSASRTLLQPTLRCCASSLSDSSTIRSRLIGRKSAPTMVRRSAASAWRASRGAAVNTRNPPDLMACLRPRARLKQALRYQSLAIARLAGLRPESWGYQE